MKKILMICLALVMGLGMCAAAGKPAQKKEVTTVFVTDIDCEHCVKKIMNNVPSLGKGITAASLGMLLKAKGLKVVSQKLDPYINIDPGTMSPYQHGEVFVTEDGAETDLDLGHYERFIDEQRREHRQGVRHNQGEGRTQESPCEEIASAGLLSETGEPLREVPPFFSSGRRRCGGGSRGRQAAVRERPARCRHTLQPAICPLPTA